jgi:methionine-rich copper-binding protein CopC
MSLSHPSRLRTRLLAVVLALGFTTAFLVSLPGQAEAATCPCSIFSGSQTPTVLADSDTAAVELGVKFQADQDGFVSGIRFYKGSANTGTHTGSLWTTTGTRLATVTFTAETASGWQQADFATPVAITANTTYVASYYAPNGRYSADTGFFAAGPTVSSPLTALADGAEGGNGVYRYGTGGGFPSSSYQSSNYWVDVVYSTSGADTTKPTVTDHAPASGATGVATSSSVTATFSENVQSASINWSVTGPGTTAVSGAASYNATNRTATFTPSAALATSTTFTVTISGAQDTAGNTMDPLSWTFGTAAAPGSCPCSIWASSTVPGTAAAADNSAVELGVKFRSNTDGYITGIRFYKGSGNTGTHVGSLWKTDGTKLASVTFTGESSTGWQQALFAGPVPIVAGTTYVASYYAPVGRYAANNTYFANQATTNGPLTALRNGTDGGNGVYRYGASGYPSNTYQSSNYWVDVVFSTTVDDTTAPSVSTTAPTDGENGVAVNAPISATFSEPVTSGSITMAVKDSSNASVAGSVSYAAGSQTATFTPTSALAYSSDYTVTVSGAQDPAGNTMTAKTWSFVTAAQPPPPPDQGPGGPIAVVTSSSNPYSTYLAEILRTEGLNEFSTLDVGTVSASTLSNYDVVILGNVTVSASQVSALTSWVNGGGNLIAMRPGSNLSSLMGLTAASGTTSNAYLKVDPSSAAGAGIVTDTIQFHGTADRYSLSGAAAVATIYSSATAATTFPAVTLRSVGSNGGEAAAFTYDLPQSIVQTRQGNPAWATQERDGQAPIRSDDKFFGGSSTDWVNLSKVAIPQADEQQRLLANLIQTMNRDTLPLPRFWYFPKGLKAVLIGTGDDHGNNGTAGRFDQLLANSPAGCSVSDWTCLRYSSYVYPNTPLSNSAAVAYKNEGFEIGVHETTNCGNFTPSSLAANYANDLAAWRANYPGLPDPVSNRTHCIAFSDWSSQPKTELANGMRMDGNYYYWPGSWLQDRPGFMTGSGMPMRFADTDGTMIDVYQATTQMTDESGQSYPFTVNQLLDNATGPLGYYGAFNANFHTDQATEPESDALISAALSHGVPIVSGQQMTTWLDGRNASSYADLGWSNDTLSFTVKVGAGADGLTGLVPIAGPGGTQLSGLSRAGSAVSYSTVTVKGQDYAQFAADAGTYAASYAAPAAAFALTAASAEVSPTPDLQMATLSWTTTTTATSEVSLGTSETKLKDTTVRRGAETKHELKIKKLKPDTTYYYRLSSTDLRGRTATWPAADQKPARFTTPSADEKAPKLKNVTVSAMPDGTALVAWTTDEPSGSTVELGPSAAKLAMVASDGTATTDHEVLLTGLDPDATYWFVAGSADPSGNRATTKARSFSTPAAGVTDQQAASFRLGKASGDVVVDDSGLGAISLTGKTPGKRAGTFTSRVLDAQAMTDWDRAFTRVDLPKGTKLSISVRTGSMAVPDGSWTDWTTVPKSGQVSGSSRYLQYKLTLEASSRAAAPSVSAVGFSNNAGSIEHEKETR